MFSLILLLFQIVTPLLIEGNHPHTINFKMRYISAYMLCVLNGKTPKSIDIEFALSSVDVECDTDQTPFDSNVFQLPTCFAAPNEYKGLIYDYFPEDIVSYGSTICSFELPYNDYNYGMTTPNHPPAMDMIKAAIKSSQDVTRIIERYGPFLRRVEDNNDDGKKMVRWAALNDNKDGPHCSWAPMGGRGASHNLSGFQSQNNENLK